MELPKAESLILPQISAESAYSLQYVNPKRIETLDRYRLYSNQKKDKSLVSDTLGFTVFQTVHSKLYDDRLSVTFAPGHPDDTDKVDGLNPVAKFDNSRMNKDQSDFDWIWYACFWGSGFLDVSEWDSKKMLMKPSVVNNATLLPDPDGYLVNGDQRGFGAWRFWGREIAKTKLDMKSEGFEGYESLQAGADASSLAYYAKQKLNTAQNLATPSAPVGDFENELIPLLEWFTHVDGQKWIFYTDLKQTKIVKARKLWSKKWPLIQRKLFPIPNDAFGVSLWDLTEDKQRARSVLTNLGLISAKADLYGMFVYDRNIISPTSDLSFGLNKWIPADGNPREGVVPLQKPQPGQMVQYIMDLLDQAAEKATAATNMQQGIQNDNNRSANEVVRVFNQSEARISTAAKVFGWSEREFWSWWLENSSHYITSLHKKFVRIDGAFGPKFETYSGKDFSLAEDPDIYIESKELNDARNEDAKNDAVAFNNMIAQDQSANRRYWNKRNARLFGLESSEVDRLYPPTPDELIAKQENVQLDKNTLPKISIHDDHQTHLLIHANAGETKATAVHIAAHQKALMIKRQMNTQAQAQGIPTTPTPGEVPTSAQTTPNMAGQGSAPAAKRAPVNSVQQ